MCVPGLTIEEFFAESHERERPIFHAVQTHLESLGEVTIEAVQVGVFFKNGPVFAELRPKKKWVAATFKLPVKLSSDRLSRKVISSSGTGGGLWYHVVNVADVSEVDGQLLDWMTEAFFAVEDR